eukprot:7044303-Pyramimonas_sp.AAC.1
MDTHLSRRSNTKGSTYRVRLPQIWIDELEGLLVTQTPVGACSPGNPSGYRYRSWAPHCPPPVRRPSRGP